MATPRSAGSVVCAELGAGQPLEVDRVYREHAATVSRWIRRLWYASDADRVQDLLHEVFLVVQRQLPDFRSDAKLTTWLYAITVRVVNASRRKERLRRLLWVRLEPELVLDAAPTETPESRIEREHTAAAVYQILDVLSDRDRTLLILFELEGLSGEEIASVLGMAVGSVSVNLHRARKRFEKEFTRRTQRARLKERDGGR